MAATVLLFSCFVGFLAQSIYGQCLSRNSNNFGINGHSLAYNDCPLAAAHAAAALTAADGGGFTVISSSPIAPYGVSIASDNEYSGILSVIGQLPFLGTANLESAVFTAGAGSVRYGCGYGNVGIVSEDIVSNTAGLGYGNGLVIGGASNGWCGCNCGTLI